MTTKSIRISHDIYEKLVEIAGKIQMDTKKPASIEDAIKYLLRKKISDLAGSWEIEDNEIKEIKESLEKGWKNWKLSA
jgi:predicted CopG family antitoxin